MNRAWKDLALATASLALSRALAFAATVVVARLLPVGDFATYLVVVSATVLLIPLADAGMWPLVARTASRNRDAPLLSASAAANRVRAPAWGLALAVATAGVVGDLWPHAELYLLAVTAAISQSVLDAMSGELFAHRRFAAGALLRVAPAAIGLAGAFLLAVVARNALAAMTVFAAARLVPVLALRPFFPAATRMPGISLRRSLPFALATVLTVAYVRSDMLLLSAFEVPAASIALYGVAYNVLVGLQLLPSGVATALYPRLPVAPAGRAARLVRGGFGLTLCGSCGALALVFLALEQVFALFGSHYADGAATVRPLLLVLLAISITQVGMTTLQARDRERRALGIITATLVANVAGHLALIPLWGIRGALVATAAAELLAAAAVLYALRHMAVRWPEWLSFAAVAGVVAGALVLPLPSPAVSAGLAGAMVLMWAIDAFGVRSNAREVAALLAARARRAPANGRTPLVDRTGTVPPGGGVSRVLIVGGAGWGNVGDDLIASRLVTRVLGEGHRATVAGGRMAIGGLPPGVRQVPIAGSARSRLALVWEIARSREVLIGGGGLFEDRMPHHYRPFYRVARFAHRLGKPYRIVAVGVGPFRRRGSAEAYRWTFDHAASASVRDAASRDRVTSTGARAPAVEPDPAVWAVQEASETEVEYDLVVNLRRWEQGVRSELPPVKSTSEIVEATAAALNDHYGRDARIALVSMSTLEEDRDAVALEGLASRLHCRVERFYSGDLREIEALVASAGGVLSMRLHLALLAVAHSVPVAAIAYDEKVGQQGGMWGFPTVSLAPQFGAHSVTQLLAGLTGAACQRSG